MCGYFCIGFIDFMFAGRSWIDFTSIFSPYDFKKNDKIIKNYFKWASFSKCYFLKIEYFTYLVFPFSILNL